MSSLAEFRGLILQTLAEWRELRLVDLQYWHRAEARLAIIALLGLAVILVIARWIFSRAGRPHGVVLPAILASVRPARAAVLRHVPLLLFLAGLPFFVFALADPFTALVSTQASFPGRRIGLMIDASISMRTPFTAPTMNTRAATDATFFTTVAAAERFVRLRMKGRYRDLIGLVEFGNRAYVVTPFTSDYDNILLSISLIGDPVEFSMFPDQGTVIASAIDESIGLFRAFDFLDAKGNLMVLFTDGEDTRVMLEDKSLDDVLKAAVEAEIPVYLVRTNFEREEGQIIPDEIWRPAVEKTGGKFYAASTEESLLAAIADIDRVATGTIELKQYSSQHPRYAPFALIACAFWAAAAASRLVVPYFQKLS